MPERGLVQLIALTPCPSPALPPSPSLPQIYDIHKINPRFTKSGSIAKEQLVDGDSDFLYSASFCWIRGAMNDYVHQVFKLTIGVLLWKVVSG